MTGVCPFVWLEILIPERGMDLFVLHRRRNGKGPDEPAPRHHAQSGTGVISSLDQAEGAHGVAGDDPFLVGGLHHDLDLAVGR